MIAKVRSRYWKRTHKFGILIPKSVKEALLLDDKTGTDLWQKAIEKEMKNVMPAFTFLEQDEKVWQPYFVPCTLHHDVAHQRGPQVCIYQCEARFDRFRL